MEAYAEYFMPSTSLVRTVKAGRYRTPFGIASASEHAYVGFLRPPLIRYGSYYGLSAGYLEHGATVVVGTPKVSGELSVGRSSDVGDAIRRPGTNVVGRIEATLGPLVVGASGIDTMPYLPSSFALGRMQFAGLDARWMWDGIQLRGEWIAGRPFKGTRTTGGYVDVFVHRPALGPVTILGRAERLDYYAISPFALYTHRYTAGARVRVWQQLSVSAALTHQAGQQTQQRRTVLDVGVSYSLRKDF
jgi:hypothetical protein